MEQIAEGGGGFSLTGKLQGKGQHALAGDALGGFSCPRKGVGLDDILRSLPTSLQCILHI